MYVQFALRVIKHGSTKQSLRSDFPQIFAPKTICMINIFVLSLHLLYQPTLNLKIVNKRVHFVLLSTNVFEN